MKVLVLSDYYPPNTRGGADIAAERLSAELARRGHTVRVVASVQDRSRVGEGVVRGVQVLSVFSRYPARLRGVMAVYNPMVAGRVAEEIGAFRPDVVHAHNIHTHVSFQSLLVSHRAGVPVALTAHDHQLFCADKFTCSEPERAVAVPAAQCARCQRFRYFPLRNPLIRRAVRLSGAQILAVSVALREDLLANGFDPAAVEVAHNGLEPSYMEVGAEQVEAFARRHGLEGKRLILFGGRVSHAKGIDQAVAALGRLPRELDSTLLVLGAGDDYVRYVRDLARGLGVEGCIAFLPWLSGDDLKAAYALSVVCLTPSVYREPFNLINIEAMAARKPVVTTCFGGPPEVVVEGVTGHVVNPHDADLMAERLRGLLVDGARAKAMGEAGYRRLLDRFTIGHQAERVLAEYGRARAARRGDWGTG